MAAPTVKVAGRSQRGLDRSRAESVGDAQLVTGVGAQCVLGRQLRAPGWRVGVESPRT